MERKCDVVMLPTKEKAIGKPIKTSWDKEEVMALCFQAYNLRIMDSQIRSTAQMNKWIEEKLK